MAIHSHQLRRSANPLMCLSLLAACAVISSGCATTYTLDMKAHRPPRDSSSLSPRLRNKVYSKIMIMPPSGTQRGEFDSMIALCEKVFIKKGVTPINGAVTGRVVMQAPGTTGKDKNESAQNLSDVERAFVMARETGCDAILQIGKFETVEGIPTRFFIADRPSTTCQFREVEEEEYQAWQSIKHAFSSRLITFIGRLSDVESAEVLASFNIVSAANWNLPSDYSMKLYNGYQNIYESYPYYSLIFVNSSWEYKDGTWVIKATDRAIEDVLEKVADSISHAAVNPVRK